MRASTDAVEDQSKSVRGGRGLQSLLHHCVDNDPLDRLRHGRGNSRAVSGGQSQVVEWVDRGRDGRGPGNIRGTLYDPIPAAAVCNGAPHRRRSTAV